jgi:hypothetical protein
MMSLANPSLIQVVKKQYVFKLKSYIQVFSNLIFIQLIGIFFSFGGSGGMGGGSSSLQMNVKYLSSDNVVFFTILWAFVTAILITTKAYRYDDFVFVSNRFSSNLSNSLFLLTASITGGVTAILSTSLMKVILFYFVRQPYVNSTSTTSDFLLGISATSLYVFLFSALGYLVGTLVQIHKGFILFLPAIFIGVLVLNNRIVEAVFGFIFTEHSFPIFIVKIIVILGLLFSSAFALSNRWEVRQ